MDFGKNTKTNDGDIHDVLYSGGGGNYSLPADPGSGPAYMQQPMNRPMSSSKNPLANVTNANEKLARMNKLKEQQRLAFERKKQMTGVKRDGGAALQLGAALALEDMNLDRKAEFEGDAFDPFNIGNSSSKVDL